MPGETEITDSTFGCFGYEHLALKGLIYGGLGALALGIFAHYTDRSVSSTAGLGAGAGVVAGAGHWLYQNKSICGQYLPRSQEAFEEPSAPPVGVAGCGCG